MTATSTDTIQLATPAEAASIMRISRAALYRLMAEGALPFIKIGASRRIRHADLAAFQAAHLHGAD